jgi:heme/copper-type cytochrome/quinol oxidase subunit 2
MAPQNGMGTAAMVLGILSCCLFCLYGVLSLVLGVLAVVFGVKGRRRAARGEASNHGQAQAGLITGIIGIFLGIAVIVLLVIGITTAIRHEKARDPYSDGALRPAATAAAAR